MALTLEKLFASAGNALHATPFGFRTGHQPVHTSASGTCVSIDPAKDLWYCHSCQQGGGLVQAVMSLEGKSQDEAEAFVQAQGSPAQSKTKPATLADTLVDGVVRRATLFHDEYREPWAVVPVGTHQETMRLHDRTFRRWLSYTYYSATQKSPNAEAMSQAITTLEGKALHASPTHPLAWRVTRQGDAILYDLADAEWRVVELTAQGWSLTERPGVFRRGANTAPQVEPQAGGNVKDVLAFYPPLAEHDALLLKVYLVTAFIPEIDHPIPTIAGDHGAAKSTATAVTRYVVDPAQEVLLTMPNDPNELALLLARNYMPAFDNLDGMQSWQMDALCRACTGAGISKRRLYTDEDEVIMKFWRCVVLNGLYPGATRPDIMDRVLPLQFTRLTPTQFKSKREFWAEFERARPRLVGAMFDALTTAMRIHPSVHLDALPRLGDFCTWGYAVAEALGGQGEAFLEAYQEAIGNQTSAAIDNHPVASALLALLGGREVVEAQAHDYLFWEGTAAELLTALEQAADDQRIDKRARSWPKAANALMRRVNEIKSNLLDLGIKIATAWRGADRQITLYKSMENIVGTGGTQQGVQMQCLVDNDRHNDIYDAPTISLAPDADQTHILLAGNTPLHNTLSQTGGTAASTNDIFPTLGAGGQQPFIEVGPTLDGPLPEYITTSAQLDALLPALCAAPLLAIDTETTGLDPYKDRLRLVQFALPDRVIIVDAFTCPLPRLGPVLTAPHTLAFHNGKFDLRFLRRAGLPLPEAPVFDTMLVAQLLGAGTTQGLLKESGLAAVAQRYLQLDLDKTAQTSDWRGTLTPGQLYYAARDAAVTLQLVPVLQAALAAAHLARVAEIECRCVPALAWLEMAGLPVDAERWRARALQDGHTAQALAAQLDALLAQSTNGTGLLVPPSTNWQSPKQVLDLLTQRGLSLTSTDAPTLAASASLDPLIPLLLDYREAVKRAGTYGLAWLDKHVQPVTGRVHADYLQLGSQAGRMSCTRPNVQNLPRGATYRGCITAAPGWCVVKADYSQIELRIAAVMAPDPTMLAAYQAGQDLHTTTAARLTGVPPEQITPDARQLAKAVNFGLLYGMGAPTLQTYAAQNYRVTLTRAEAEQYRQRFFSAYGGVRQWHRDTGQTPPGETRTLAGRRRQGVQQFTQRLNSPVQGSGADGLKLALAQLFAHRLEVPEAQLVACVHDEIVAECPIEDAAATAAWLQRHMTDAMQQIVGDRVPVVVETSIGQDWAGTPLP